MIPHAIRGIEIGDLAICVAFAMPAAILNRLISMAWMEVGFAVMMMEQRHSVNAGLTNTEDYRCANAAITSF